MISFRRQGSTGGPTRNWAPAEREADRTADAVLDRDTPATRPHAEVPPTAGKASLPGVGKPLDDTGRAFFERRLGADLSTVRLHAGPAADQATRDEHARAYTVGEHVVLGADADQVSLAHELTHVLQQRRAGRAATQRQERPRAGGVGRVPPKVDFDVVRERAPAEDAKVLFGHDSVALTAMDVAPLLPRLATNRALIVDIDGYASTEGDVEYNLNLSAHRAAALKAVLEPLLPPGSTVLLHAHGATTEFGEPPGNRRVGIRVTEAPVPLVPPLFSEPRFGQRPRLLPDLRLHLDLGPIPLPPGVLPPIPDVRLRDPATGEPYAPLQPDTPGPIRPPWPPVITPQPDLSPKIFRLGPETPVVDWGSLRQTFVDHGAGAIDPRMAAAAEKFTRDWYQHYRALGIPEERARWLANFGTRITIGRELAREGNTASDRLDEELRRSGQPTPIGGSVDLLDLLRKLRKEKR